MKVIIFSVLLAAAALTINTINMNKAFANCADPCQEGVVVPSEDHSSDSGTHHSTSTHDSKDDSITTTHHSTKEKKTPFNDCEHFDACGDPRFNSGIQKSACPSHSCDTPGLDSWVHQSKSHDTKMVSHDTQSQPKTLEGDTGQPASQTQPAPIYGNPAADKCISSFGSGVTPDQIDQCYAQHPQPVENGCNNTETSGPATDFFNGIGDCPVHVLFESPTMVQVQANDISHGYSFVQLFETGGHYYEISKTDDGSYTTVVLAPLQ